MIGLTVVWKTPGPLARGANPDKKILQQTLELRREIDSNQQTIKDLETFARQASTQRARLNAELSNLKAENGTLRNEVANLREQVAQGNPSKRRRVDEGM